MNKFLKIIFFFLIIIFSTVLIKTTAYAQGGNPVEIRYMSSNVVNSHYELGTSQSASFVNEYGYGTGILPVYYGIRVFKISGAGTQTEITGGTPVAIVSRTVNGSGMQSTTWNYPQTILVNNDSIIVGVYMKIGINSWESMSAFSTSTPRLNASQLNSTTWTVYYYTSRSEQSGNTTVGEFSFGDSTVDSRIENFAYTSSSISNPNIFGFTDYAYIAYLHIRSYHPVASNGAAVILVPGGKPAYYLQPPEDHPDYIPFIEDLTDRGYLVLMPYSTDYLSINDWENFLDFVTRITTTNPNIKKTIYVAHSAGGMVTFQYFMDRTNTLVSNVLYFNSPLVWQFFLDGYYCEFKNCSKLSNESIFIFSKNDDEIMNAYAVCDSQTFYQQDAINYCKAQNNPKINITVMDPGYGHDPFGTNTETIGLPSFCNTICNGKYPNTWCDGNTKKSCSSTCQYSEVNCASVSGYNCRSSTNVCTCVEDINGDLKINSIDTFTEQLKSGSVVGDSRYDPSADINKDGRINLIDYFRVALAFGKSCPAFSAVSSGCGRVCFLLMSVSQNIFHIKPETFTIIIFITLVSTEVIVVGLIIREKAKKRT